MVKSLLYNLCCHKCCLAWFTSSYSTILELILTDLHTMHVWLSACWSISVPWLIFYQATKQQTIQFINILYSTGVPIYIWSSQLQIVTLFYYMPWTPKWKPNCNSNYFLQTAKPKSIAKTKNPNKFEVFVCCKWQKWSKHWLPCLCNRYNQFVLMSDMNALIARNSRI